MSKGGIIRSVVAPHSPRMMVESGTPEFLQGCLKGLYQLGDELRALKPDVFVVHSTHWVSTFDWYLTSHAVHKGICIADEAPDMWPGQAYERKGDPSFVDAIMAETAPRGLRVRKEDNPHHEWDYGSLVPLKYIDPKSEIPVILLSTCIMSDVAECMNVGDSIRVAAEKAGKRVVFIASTAFTHLLTRTPSDFPLKENFDKDRKLIQMMIEGRIEEAKTWFPQYADEVEAEMHGRNLATMLGSIDLTKGAKYTGVEYGTYGQSSSSGNTSVSIRAA
jgi:3,4-dihydroxyphenylacetate 2,3-dioxygenase